MINRLYNWLNRNKDKENIFFIGLKFIYKISVEWVHAIIIILMTLVMTDFYEKSYWTSFAIILIIMIMIEIYFYLIGNYKKYKYQVQRNSDLILNEIITATTALDDYVNSNNKSGKGIFEYASVLVTASMYKVLKDVTNCESRISVIQQFHEDGKKRKCTMISRKSKKRTSSAKKELLVEYTKNKNYYFLKILKENIDTYVFFDTKNEIDKNFFWRNNKKKSDIYQYIGLAEKVETKDIAFLLQIDAMEKKAFGNDKDELAVFAENYIYPYIQFLKHAYTMERTIKGDERNE